VSEVCVELKYLRYSMINEARTAVSIETSCSASNLSKVMMIQKFIIAFREKIMQLGSDRIGCYTLRKKRITCQNRSLS